MKVLSEGYAGFKWSVKNNKEKNNIKNNNK